jgi:chromatin remodeling complex protein RSC6
MPRGKKSTPIAEPKQVTEPVVAEPVATEPEVTLSDDFTTLLSALTAMRSQLTGLTAQVRALRTRSERAVKAAQKASKKRRSTNRKPSGFTKPTLISDELATFLGRSKGSEMARTEVTREINAYIKEHNLQNPENKRQINPDAKLRKLLKMSKSDSLSYFNLQTYMKALFPKVEATA